ncbi:hypothetical protein BLD44_027940 [Mastigocladus laminosus UU774]|nr:hypothetical protein BLD44_027940 [Mastigocladus laminosus UU774]
MDFRLRIESQDLSTFLYPAQNYQSSRKIAPCPKCPTPNAQCPTPNAHNQSLKTPTLIHRQQQV